MSKFNRRALIASAAIAGAVALAFVLVVQRTAALARGSNAKFNEIEHALEQEVDAGLRAGFVAGVATRDGVKYETAVGYADRESKIPMTLSTRFRIASMTKPIVTAAALQLAERGELSLDDPVSRFIPAFANSRVAISEEPGPDGEIATRAPAREITVRDLLTHMSGIGYVFNEETTLDRMYRLAVSRRDGLTLDDLAARLAAIPLYADPGAEWRYSFSIDIAGLVVEKASGLPLEEFVRRNLFEPLGMTQTKFIIDAEDMGDAAVIYEFDNAGAMKPAAGDDIFGNPNKEGFGLALGGGGLVSTLDDYLRFCMMMLHGGELGGVRVLSEKTVKEMMAGQLGSGDASRLWEHDYATFGFGGLVVTDAEKADVVAAAGEWGWSGYWDTWFVVDPADDVAVVLLAQTQSGPHTPPSNARTNVKEIAYEYARTH